MRLAQARDERPSERETQRKRERERERERTRKRRERERERERESIIEQSNVKIPVPESARQKSWMFSKFKNSIQS